MSKTTTSLFLILFLFICLLGFTVYGIKENPIITSITQSLQHKIMPADAELLLSTETKMVQPGQTATIAVLIHNINPHPNIAEIELSYDPNVITINSINPGTFFTNPTIALQTIDPVAGRISYALRCPNAQKSSVITDCVNPSSQTVATVNISVNPYVLQNSTQLTFLPRTVIRIKNGLNVLRNSMGLTLTIGNKYASSPAAQNFLIKTVSKITPVQ